MEDVPSEWTKDAKRGWRRQLSGIELFEQVCALKWPNEHNILPCLLLKRSTSTSEGDFAERLRTAWSRTICSVPAVTFSVVEDENGTLASYADHIEAHELENLVENTLTFHDCYVDSTNNDQHWDHLDELRRRVSRTGVVRNIGSTVFLDVVQFRCRQDEDDDSALQTTGFVMRVDHAAMDGTGAYYCIDKLLSHLVEGMEANLRTELKTGLIIKADPHPPLAQYFPPLMKQKNVDAGVEDLLMLLARSEEVLPGPPPQMMPSHPCTSSQKRHTFTAQETEVLLFNVQKLRRELEWPQMTISQLAVASHLVPLLRRFPLPNATQIGYSTAINVRNKLKIPSGHYSNAFAAITALYDVQDLEAIFDSDAALSSRDISALRRLAVAVSRDTVAHQSKGDELAILFDKLLSILLNDFSAVDLPPRRTSICMSDGITERYLKRKYEGKDIALDVLGVHTGGHVHQPYLIARSATFRNQLTLSLDYNEEIYQGQDVQEMVQEWATTLQLAVSGTSA